MVSWGWIPICLIAGGVIGFFICGLIAVCADDAEQKRRDER